MSMTVEEVISMLTELCDDQTVPKNIKDTFTRTKGILSSDEETSIKVNKALHDLEGIADDVNIQPYTRTQIWSLISQLEKI